VAVIWRSGRKCRNFPLETEIQLRFCYYLTENLLRVGLPGDRIQVGWNFPHLSKPSLGSTQPPIQWVAGLSRG
jgi:hypothetical protein